MEKISERFFRYFFKNKNIWMVLWFRKLFGKRFEQSLMNKKLLSAHHCSILSITGTFNRRSYLFNFQIDSCENEMFIWNLFFCFLWSWSRPLTFRRRLNERTNERTNESQFVGNIKKWKTSRLRERVVFTIERWKWGHSNLSIL